VALREPRGEALAVAAGVGAPEGAPLRVALWHALARGDTVGEREPEGLGDADPVRLPDADAVAEPVGAAVAEPVPVREAVADADTDRLGVTVAVEVWVAVHDPVELREPAADGVRDALRVGDADAVADEL
jgi:hypothetical protein